MHTYIQHLLLPSSLQPYHLPLLSNSWPLFNCCYIHIYVHVYVYMHACTHKKIKIVRSILCYFYVQFQGWVFDIRLPISVFILGESYFSSFRQFLGTFSSLGRVEFSWAFPCVLWHVCFCCHFYTVMLVSI